MKSKLLYTIYILFFVIMGLTAVTAQSSIDLDEVLSLVLEDSYVVTAAKNQKEIAQATYDFYRSQLKPTVSLRASLPNYSKTFSPIVQPDGTVSFTSIQQANSSLSLFATQVLPATGGTLFLNSDIQRFDDFSLDTKQFNGNPIRLGINQPLFGFNPWKYQKNIQTLLKEESLLDYNIRIEESLGLATDQYFNILIAKQNLEIAKTNELVNEKLLAITEERLILGKVSRDEKLQLEIELNNAKLSVSQAGFEVEQSIASLYTYLSKTIPSDDTVFDVPDILADRVLDIESLLQESKTNRPEIIAYQRERDQAQMDLAEAKADFGIQANLQASIGLARGAREFKEVYTDPFNEQQFNISLQVPILDWGRRKSAMKQIEIREKDIVVNYEQQFLELENSIRQRGYLFTRLQSEIKLLKEIMDKADERFSISNERYILGNIDITNLTLAQREKDQTKRNYINALKSYWVTYYELRALSGYDILNDQEIIYQ